MREYEYRSKDFELMEVRNINGKKVGMIKGIAINFDKCSIKGFILSSYQFSKKKSVVFVEDIISFNEQMIASKITKSEALDFFSIRGMDVIDIKGNIIGILQDMIIDGDKFIIKGIIVSTGFIKDMISGKKIYLPEQLQLGEENLLYSPEKENIEFISKPHNFMKDEIINEEKI